MSEADGEPTPEQQAAFHAWAQHVRGLHRLKRGVGLAGCGVGIILMAWGRLGGGPDWATWTGLGVVAASWLLFGWIVWARFQWVKKNPFDPEKSHTG